MKRNLTPIRRHLNIRYVCREGLCVQCGVCAAFCPKNNINIVRKQDGSYDFLVSDEEKCMGCNVCVHVCPGEVVKFGELNQFVFKEQPRNQLIGYYDSCYAAHSTNAEIREKASAGGVVTTLLTYLFDKKLIDGALVVRNSESGVHNPEVFLARNAEEALSAAKSKYYPVLINLGLNEIRAAKGKFVVVGLPCHIHAFRLSEKLNKRLREKIILEIGLFCGWNVSYHSLDFIARQIDKADARKIKEIRFREGKWPGNIGVVDNSNEIYTVPGYIKDLVAHIYTLPRCALCIDQMSELADISTGDAWLDEYLRRNDGGWSVVVTRTKRGQNIFNDAVKSGYIYAEPLTAESVIESQKPLIMFKKRGIYARYKIWKLFGRELPKYSIDEKLLDSEKTFKSDILDYIGGFILYVVTRLSQRKDVAHFVNLFPIWLIKVYAWIVRNLLTHCDTLSKMKLTFFRPSWWFSKLRLSPRSIAAKE